MAHPSVRSGQAPRKIGCRDVSPRSCMLNSTQMTREEQLAELGLALPSPPAPGGNYLSAKRIGSLVYLAGVISTNASGAMTGTVGLDRTVADGYTAARACA